MSISSFCRDQLLARGPLPLQTLTELAVEAGTTTARDPAAAVRGAIGYKEVQLADGLWATPMWLLEGRILTVRRLPVDEDGAGPDLDDGDDALLDASLFQEGPDPAGTRADLALLDVAARHHAVPLAGGGLLRRASYGSGWHVPKGWPGVRPGRDQLLGVRVREGQLHVELVPMTEELRRAGDLLAEELGPLDGSGCSWSTLDGVVSDNLVAALWNRMAADPTFLTSPVPPFHQCIPPLAEALHSARNQRAREASRWRMQLDLPSWLKDVAVQAAWRSDLLLDEWLSDVMARTLCELSGEENRMLEELPGEVVLLQRRRRR